MLSATALWRRAEATADSPPASRLMFSSRLLGVVLDRFIRARRRPVCRPSTRNGRPNPASRAICQVSDLPTRGGMYGAVFRPPIQGNRRIFRFRNCTSVKWYCKTIGLGRGMSTGYSAVLAPFNQCSMRSRVTRIRA